MERPNVLLTNDDGIESPGLAALVAALRDDVDLTVVAPVEDSSGVAQSITVTHAVSVEPDARFGCPAFRCWGTPADCVVLAVEHLCGRVPDLTISGINRGPNLADDVNHSGTLAAAVESVLLGVPAFAISLAIDPDNRAIHAHWETAGRLAHTLLVAARQALYQTQRVWNVNVPNVAWARLPALRVTSLGRNRYEKRLMRKGADDAAYFRVWSSPLAGGGHDKDSDTAAVAAGYPSITPLLVDRTDYPALATLRTVLRMEGGSDPSDAGAEFL